MILLKKGETNWKYILILLILAAIVGGGILGYSKYFKREISSLSKFPEIKKPEKPKIEEETANWKTYRNEKYGFEIKYPSDVNVQDEGYIDYLNGIIITFCGGEYANYCGIQGAAPHSEIYFFKFEKDGAEKDLYSFVFKGGELPWDYWPFGYDPNKRNCKILSITVDGAEGKLWDCDEGLFAFWEREKDNSFYHMNVHFLDEFPKLRHIFNQMLSTFKFLE